jgi:hypothetical protein
VGKKQQEGAVVHINVNGWERAAATRRLACLYLGDPHRQLIKINRMYVLYVTILARHPSCVPRLVSGAPTMPLWGGMTARHHTSY